MGELEQGAAKRPVRAGGDILEQVTVQGIVSCTVACSNNGRKTMRKEYTCEYDACSKQMESGKDLRVSIVVAKDGELVSWRCFCCHEHAYLAFVRENDNA